MNPSTSDPEDLKRVMRRLRKVLALSQSSEPGEAAAALHQARAIMDKYGLDHVDAQISAVEESSTTLSGTDMLRWEVILVDTIKRAMGVEVLISRYEKTKGRTRPRASVIFVGEGHRAQVAAYAFDVLRRQLRASMQTTYAALAQKAGPNVNATDIRRLLTRSQREAYANAWVSAVHQKIQALDIAVSPAVKRYMAEKEAPAMEHKNLKPSTRKHKQDALTIHLLREGFRAGSQAQLHQAMDENRGETALIESDRS